MWFPLCGFIQGLVLVDQVWVRNHSDSTRQKPPSCSNSVPIVKINKYINGGYPRNVQIFLVSTIYHLVEMEDQNSDSICMKTTLKWSVP